MSSGNRHGPGVPAPAGVIPLAEPQIQGNEWQYIKECLDTNWVSSAGPFVDRFEREIAKFVSAQYGVATASGTAALHLALLVAGVQVDDEVLVSTLTFIAPANAVRYVGAWPIFVDADPDHWQMEPNQLMEFLENGCAWRENALYNRTTGRRVKAILPVHVLGHPCDMDPIVEMARKYDLAVIEDASESLGSLYRDRSAGHLSDIACFSFNGNKVITSGGGGMIVTDNEQWAHRAKYLSTQAKEDSVEYIHQEIGYNYRLSNIQAAMGCAQLEQLDEYIAAKRRIAKVYDDTLSEIPGITTMKEAPWAKSVPWLYTILVDEAYGLDSRNLLTHLEASGIQSRPLWQPVHMSRAHLGAQSLGCDVAERLWHEGLSIPSSVGLTKEDQERVIQVLTQASAVDGEP